MWALAIAKVGIDMFARLAVDTDPPFWFVWALDGPILLFIVAATAVAALVAGLIPGLKVSSGGRLNELLKDESRGSSSMRIGKLSRLLVMGEVAMSVGLLVTAGLMVKGMIKLRTMEYGFDREEVFTARIGLFPNDFPDTESKSDLLPGSAGGAGGPARGRCGPALPDVLPGLGSGLGPFAMEGDAYATDRDYPRARGILITPGYFETFGVQPVQGTDLQPGGRPGGPTGGRRERELRWRGMLPGEEILGKRVAERHRRRVRSPGVTIVGVVPDLFMEGVGERPGGSPGHVPGLSAQNDAQFVSIAVRGRGDPLALTPVVRDEVARHEPRYPHLLGPDTAGSSGRAALVRGPLWWPLRHLRGRGPFPGGGGALWSDCRSP